MEISVGASTEKDPILAAREACRLAKLNFPSGKRIDLAIVFSSIELACVSLLKTISESLEEAPIVGCSGAAVISNKGVLRQGLAIMLLSFPPGAYFNTAGVQEIKRKTSLIAGGELGEKLLYGCRNIRRDLSILFSDGLIDDNSSLISGFQEKVGKSFPVVGGSASDNLRFLKTYLYFNRDLFTDGAVGILLGGGKLNFGMGIGHGWKPLGKPRQVTLSQGNIIYQIDGAPAVNLYEEYLAKDINEFKKMLKQVSILYPIGIHLAGEEEYLLRNVISVEDNGALRLQGDIPQDSQIRLMIGTKESCLTATRQATEETKRSLASQILNIRKSEVTKHFVVVFDSISRYILLRKDMDKELEIIKEAFGKNTPIIGLCTYGEQAPLNAISYRGRVYSHNQTISILAIGG